MCTKLKQDTPGNRPVLIFNRFDHKREVPSNCLTTKIWSHQQPKRNVLGWSVPLEKKKEFIKQYRLTILLYARALYVFMRNDGF